MYMIKGADQRDYGPVESQVVREWIAQGRANPQTLASFEGSPMKPLSSYPEFADALRTAVPPPIGMSTQIGAVPLQRQNNVAVAGLVLSVLGMCCSPFSLAGLVLSVIGLIQIQKNPREYSTSIAIPIAGIVLAVLAFALALVALSSEAVQEMFRNMK